MNCVRVDPLMRVSLFALVGITLCTNLRAQSQDDSTTVAQTITAFHDFISAGDSASALNLLSADVVIVESGNIENKEHYRTGHLAGDMGYAQAVTRQRGEIRVVVENDIAWATSTATVVGEVRGREVNSISAELMVLSRAGGEWKIRAIHWSSRRAR